MRDINITVQTMNPGTPDEFDRIFLTCPDGHDLGSVPVSIARRGDGVEFASECKHYAHKYQGAAS